MSLTDSLQDQLFQQAAQITKAHAYDIIAPQVKELKEALKEIIDEWQRQKGLFKDLEKDGWMDAKINNAKRLL